MLALCPCKITYLPADNPHHVEPSGTQSRNGSYTPLSWKVWCHHHANRYRSNTNDEVNADVQSPH